MASGETGVFARCPVCSEPIALDATVKLDMKRVVVGIDTALIHTHLAEHYTPLTTELPPSATVHLDNRDARFTPAQATDNDDDPPVQCWHTEPDSPCDWNVCRQPERLAAGDAGTDPARRS